jgi:hypothetical protein
MNVDVNALQMKIRTKHAAALAKRAGAQISPEVAAAIREAYREGTSISVIRESLREMGINMSPTKVKGFATMPRKRRVAVPAPGGASGVCDVHAQSGTDVLPQSQSGAVAASTDHVTPGAANRGMSALASLTAANAATRPGARR